MASQQNVDIPVAGSAGAAPPASSTRLRTNRAADEKDSTDPDVLNPTSLGTTSNKNVRRSKPKVDPPFWNMSMNRFLTYLTLSLLALGAFYAWRFTVWARHAGGYWNLVTGKRVAQNINPNHGPGGSSGILNNDAMLKKAASAASAAGTAATKAAKKNKTRADPKGKVLPGTGSNPDVQSQILTLATALGVTPHDLTAAIRPLIDPSVPSPAESAAKEIEMLKLQLQNAGVAQAQANAAPVEQEEKREGSLLGIVSEVLLD